MGHTKLFMINKRPMCHIAHMRNISFNIILDLKERKRKKSDVSLKKMLINLSNKLNPCNPKMIWTKRGWTIGPMVLGRNIVKSYLYHVVINSPLKHGMTYWPIIWTNLHAFYHRKVLQNWGKIGPVVLEKTLF